MKRKINTSYFLLTILLLSLDTARSQGWDYVYRGTDQKVQCLGLQPASDLLYVGGYFDKASDTTVYNVAAWNGNVFNSVGMYMGLDYSMIGTNDTVKTFCAHNGDIFAGGTFTQAEGFTTPHIARWDGAIWHGVGSGMDGEVRAIAFYQDELYAAGNFTNAGGVYASNIAKWTGSAWVAVGAGLNAPVNTLCVYNGKLYAGGEFTAAGTLHCDHIARWNGTIWDSCASGIDSASTGSVQIKSMCVYQSKLYVGGHFNLGGENIASWDESHWSCTTHFNGSMKTVYALNTYHSNLIAGGDFDSINGITCNHLATFNGSSWSELGAGTGGTVLALQEFRNWLYVGGDFSSVGMSIPPIPYRNIAKYSDGVGIKDIIEASQISIYPNPANDKIRIENVDLSKHEFISCYNTQGQFIKQLRLDHQSVSTSDLATGTYILKLESKDGPIFAKLCVLH